MIVWQTQIRTGHPAGDQQMLGEVRRQYEPQGLVVQTQPLPGGGMHVTVVRAHAPSAAPQPAYGAPPPQTSFQPQPYQPQPYQAQAFQRVSQSPPYRRADSSRSHGAFSSRSVSSR